MEDAVLVRKFRREIGWYDDPYYDTVYPCLDSGQLASLREMTQSICSAAEGILHKAERMMKEWAVVTGERRTSRKWQNRQWRRKLRPDTTIRKWRGRYIREVLCHRRPAPHIRHAEDEQREWGHGKLQGL